ncbi:MAG: hypothetical protein Q6363_010040 [Candidatus Njordarchaeota archaeon]
MKALQLPRSIDLLMIHNHIIERLNLNQWLYMIRKIVLFEDEDGKIIAKVYYRKRFAPRIKEDERKIITIDKEKHRITYNCAKRYLMQAKMINAEAVAIIIQHKNSGEKLKHYIKILKNY